MPDKRIDVPPRIYPHCGQPVYSAKLSMVNALVDPVSPERAEAIRQGVG